MNQNDTATFIQDINNLPPKESASYNSTYNPDTVKNILTQYISSTTDIETICRNNGCYSPAFYKWMALIPELERIWKRAREIRAHVYINALEQQLDTIEGIADDSELSPADRTVRINARKHTTQLRQWLVSRYNSQYADKGNNVNVVQQNVYNGDAAREEAWRIARELG